MVLKGIGHFTLTFQHNFTSFLKKKLDNPLAFLYRIFTMKHSIEIKPETGIPEACCTLAVEGSQQEQLVQMFKALGNPIRFEIMKFLLTHPGCITGDIVEHLPLAQSTVSQHLKVLREAGWICGTTEGPARCYCLDSGKIDWFRQKIGEIF